MTHQTGRATTSFSRLASSHYGALQLAIIVSIIIATGFTANARCVNASVSSFNSASTKFVDVTGGVLIPTPAAGSHIWILIFSVRLLATSTSLFSVPQSCVSYETLFGKPCPQSVASREL